MKIKLIALVLAAGLLLTTCNFIFSEYKGDGTITVSIGENSSVSKAYTTPSFPELSEIVVKISKNAVVFAEGTIDGYGSRTFTVPAGSGYKVEVQATPAPMPDGNSFSFAKKFGGVKNNVSTGGGSVYIPLSISSTPIVVPDGSAFRIYNEFKEGTMPTENLLISGVNTSSGYFFDQYGRFYYHISAQGGALMRLKSPSSSPAEAVFDNAFSGSNLAYVPRSSCLYYTYTIPQSDIKTGKIDMADGSTTVLFDVDLSNFPQVLDYTKVKGNAVLEDGTFYWIGFDNIGGSGWMNSSYVGKGTISENGIYKHGGMKYFVDIKADVQDFKFINGALFILCNKRYNYVTHAANAALYALNSDLNPRYIISFDGVNENGLLNISGFNENSIYVSYNISGAIWVADIDINTGTIKGRSKM